MRRLILLLVLAVCGVVHAQDATPETRPFLMGFTPFPYDVSVPAAFYTYETLPQNADVIMHHFDNGIPWQEALDNAPLPKAVQDDWNFRMAMTPTEMPIILSMSPINFDRTGIAAYRGEQDNLPLPAPWNSYDFDAPEVIQAYTQYLERAIEFFQPAYVNMGIEANLLMKVAPTRWDAYVTLHRAVYATLKEKYPDVSLFVSMTGIDLIAGYTDANHADQTRAFNDLIDHTDIFALSMYPYFTSYMTNAIPTEIYNQLAALTDKPLAVAETGYPAQNFNINVSGVSLAFESDQSKQEAYTRYLLESAQEHQFVFVINFVMRDYDALWQAIGGKEDLTIAWRDTGLFDEDGNERQALAVWREWLAR
jgi:hypothetical protein